MIELSIPLTPTGQMRPRHTRQGRAYKDKKQITREAQIAGYIVEQAGGKWIDGPVRMDLIAKMPIPKSWSKKKKAEAMAGGIWPDKKPDLSNIIKQIEDVAQGLLFDDDKQICEITARKEYSTKPRWIVKLRQAGLVEREIGEAIDRHLTSDTQPPDGGDGEAE